MHRKQKGATAFEQYYESLFGNQWQAIRHSLFTKPELVIVLHPQYALQLISEYNEKGYTVSVWNNSPTILEWPPEVSKGTPLPGIEDGFAYALSKASAIAALTLDLQADRILDACAAPGGKSFILASRLWGSKVELVLNDQSPERTLRLKSSMKQFPNLRITSYSLESMDPATLGTFDRILLDAPCSSEAHVLRSPSHLKRWRMNRISQLRGRQEKLLYAAASLLSKNGFIRYVTCAINSLENESLVLDLIEKGWHLKHLPKSPWKPLLDSQAQLFDTWRCWPHLEKSGPLFVADLNPPGVE